MRPLFMAREIFDLLASEVSRQNLGIAVLEKQVGI